MRVAALDDVLGNLSNLPVLEGVLAKASPGRTIAVAAGPYPQERVAGGR